MDQVVEWLDANDIPHDEIHLRPNGDYRKGVDVKRSIYRELLQPRFDVVASYDDNPSMVEMYTEELGADRVFAVEDPDVPPNKDIPPAPDPKYPHGRPVEKVLGDSPQPALFDPEPEAHEVQKYKTSNLFEGYDWGSSDSKRVGSRVYVPPHVRATPEGEVIHVDGYWRELSRESAVGLVLSGS
jgi:hypothetical protein